MKWGGKLVGGALGALAGGPVGALLGVIAGHLVDDKLEGAVDPREALRRRPLHRVEDAEATDDGPDDEEVAVGDPKAVNALFFQVTFEVMGHVAKADGRVSDEDIRSARAVMLGFRLTEAQMAQAIGHFTVGKSADYDLERAVMSLRRVCAGRPDLLRNFLEIQLRAAIGGSDLRGPARPMLTRAAAMLGVGGLEFARLETVLRQRHGAQGANGARAGGGAGQGDARDGRERVPAGARHMSLAEAYDVLGVRSGAGDDVVVKAYRRQLSRHHPDKLRANGLPESMLEHAKQRTQQIIEAWDTIRAARGIKP
ncbi:MAG: co-chaperone DjlA [Gammaproteobacteria bacterium]|nr:co-chaperone DjlA [Gammaproteobacteria bacterium]